MLIVKEREIELFSHLCEHINNLKYNYRWRGDDDDDDDYKGDGDTVMS